MKMLKVVECILGFAAATLTLWTWILFFAP